MTKYMKLRKKRKFDKINRLCIVIILIILSTFLFLSFINHKVGPILFNFAEVEATKLANLVINKAITKQVTAGINMKELFSIVQNKNGEIETIDFNPVIVNRVLNMTTNLVQMNLKAIEQGNIDSVEIPEEILVQYDKNNLKKGIIYEIPMGVITGNVFLSNIGPRVPVKLSLIGNVLSNIYTKINQYGINNALVEIFIHISVTEQVNLPLMSKRVVVDSDVPVAIKVIQGKIPQYYQASGLEKNSSILSIPIK